MANISKFKDKKTGEVYDLGPKKVTLTVTEDMVQEEDGQLVCMLEYESNEQKDNIMSLSAGDCIEITFGINRYTYNVRVVAQSDGAVTNVYAECPILLSGGTAIFMAMNEGMQFSILYFAG